jgi:8-oxo-dGTP pyrophosphatase MutT (NUDIX family)
MDSLTDRIRVDFLVEGVQRERMADLGSVKPSVIDIAWQMAFRLGFPLARLWWRVRRRKHQGALVAVHVGPCLLLLRSSYRRAWNFPGGSVHIGEAPDAAARRELAEEIGLVVDAPLRPTGVVRGLWDGRDDTVFLFALRLDRLPALRLDNREIVSARLVAMNEANGLPLTGPVKAYVREWLSDGAAATNAV